MSSAETRKVEKCLSGKVSIHPLVAQRYNGILSDLSETSTIRISL